MRTSSGEKQETVRAYKHIPYVSNPVDQDYQSLDVTVPVADARIDDDLRAVVNLMNPMYFIGQNDPGLAGHWWIRMGSSANHTSLTVIGNLAASLENRNKNVNARLYWDAGHGADEDAEDFIAWIGKIAGDAARR